MPDTDRSAQLTAAQAGTLPDRLGLEWSTAVVGLVRGRMTVARHHMAPNGFLHAASVIALADSACGYGCVVSLPEGASGFTTLELKSNFLGTAREGDGVATEARLVHGGRTTQVWDAVVTAEATGKTIALFPLHPDGSVPESLGAAGAEPGNRAPRHKSVSQALALFRRRR